MNPDHTQSYPSIGEVRFFESGGKWRYVHASGEGCDLPSLAAAQAEVEQFLAAGKIEAELEPAFVCPACGGRAFGRDTGGDPPDALPTVRCHDEFKKRCAWRGEWPPKA